MTLIAHGVQQLLLELPDSRRRSGGRFATLKRQLEQVLQQRTGLVEHTRPVVGYVEELSAQLFELPREALATFDPGELLAQLRHGRPVTGTLDDLLQLSVQRLVLHQDRR